jgi:chromosome segregation ATPase
MDFGILRVFEAVLAAAGWKVALTVLLLVVVIVALVRLAPSWLADRRARDVQDAQDKSASQRALQARIDTKDAMLEKILTNHIAHLEVQLAASREFFSLATERLLAIDSEVKEARVQLAEIHLKVADISEDTTVLRDRHP